MLNSRATLSSMPAISHLAVEHLQCGWCELRYAMRTQYTPNFKTLRQNKKKKECKITSIILNELHVDIITFWIHRVK